MGGGLTEGAFITMIHKDHELKILKDFFTVYVYATKKSSKEV